MNQKCFSESAASRVYLYGKTSYQRDRYRITWEILGADVKRNAAA